MVWLVDDDPKRISAEADQSASKQKEVSMLVHPAAIVAAMVNIIVGIIVGIIIVILSTSITITVTITVTVTITITITMIMSLERLQSPQRSEGHSHVL
ncbi:hypothetical protein AK812_SmicGene9679 [Symbiodinium microadriaticum]|uniref:Uncharacterized protein n=1 Tax=Symbiodinium microadriaticum TaxID=2951 RepID=A0A1Q9EI07_SYMMI|nr:hypothetical protein AK812_SmicGene9679 [Symbiodinium microadriaticum]